MSSARKLKKEIFSLLQQEDFHKVLQRLEQYRPPDLIHPLFSSICHHNQKVRWNGIFAFGPTVEKLTRSNMEDARVVMRRFLWSLNDESGGIGWGAPEAMAECRVCSQGLRKEYLHMLVSYCQEDGDELFQDGNFIELPALQGGLLWGLLRVASAYPHCMKKYHLEREMSFYLSSNDVQVRGLALLLVSQLGYLESCLEGVAMLAGDDQPFTLHTCDGSQQFNTGSFARKLLGGRK